MTDFHIPVLAVVDIDRTLLDSDALVVTAVEIALQLGVDIDAFMDAKRYTELSGSFNALGWFQGNLAPRDYDRLVRRLSQRDFLYPDAHAFLDYIANCGIPILLMTHGQVEAQRFKITSNPCLADLDYLIVNAPDKGARLQAIYDAAGVFAIRADTGKTFVADRIILVDDKASNFVGLVHDAPVLGLHLAGRERRLGGEMPMRFSPRVLHGGLDEAPSVIQDWL